MRRCDGTGRIVPQLRVEITVLKCLLIQLSRFPNCIVDEHTAATNSAVKLCGNESGCCLKYVASAFQAFKKWSTSSGFTLNLLIRMTGPTFFSSICSENVTFSSISTSFIISFARYQILLFILLIIKLKQ